MSESSPLPAAPVQARRLFDRLEGHRENIKRVRDEKNVERQAKMEYLAMAGEMTRVLDNFSEQLFSELVNALQMQLTRALQDVLDQPIELKEERDLKAGGVTLGFYIERAGQREDMFEFGWQW